MKKRFEEMVSNLKRNPHVEITQLVFADSATAADIEAAKKRTNGVLPGGIEAFYREMNGFQLEWKETASSILAGREAEVGSINILPIGGVTGDHKGHIWFDHFVGGDTFKPVKPFDLFAPEACTAFWQADTGELEDSMYFHYIGEDLVNTNYTFLEYIDRLLASRGYWYWIKTLCEGMEATSTIISFRENMPRIFEDYREELFQPKRS